MIEITESYLLHVPGQLLTRVIPHFPSRIFLQTDFTSFPREQTTPDKIINNFINKLTGSILPLTKLSGVSGVRQIETS